MAFICLQWWCCSSSSSHARRALVSTTQSLSQYRLYNCSNNGQLRRSPDLVALEYADLNLAYKVPHELSQLRVRQHVNPLSSSFSRPAPVPDWKQVFRDPTLPLTVDIGSVDVLYFVFTPALSIFLLIYLNYLSDNEELPGSGRFLIWLAKRDYDPGNYLGLEIRHKLVMRAQFWVKELGLNNICFIFANATVSFEQLVSTYPGPLRLVSILCPDPHFKKRHQKRRIVQKHLVDGIINHLMPAGKIFVQSDVLEVALDMRNQFDAYLDSLQHIDVIEPSMHCDNDGWLLSNPIGIRTEREIHAEFEGAKIYKRVYLKRL